MSAPMPGSGRYPALQWTDEMVQRYWSWQAQFPEQYFTNRFGHLIARRLKPLLGGRRSVLDYGSGVGFLERHLAALGLEVSATDASPDAVTATNRRNDGVPGFKGAAPLSQLLGQGLRFDAILSIEVIEHLSDAHLQSYLGALRQLLAPGGIAIVTTPNDENLRDAETYCPCCSHVFHRWQHLRSWSAASLSATLAAHGLLVERAFGTDFARPGLSDPVALAKRGVKRLLGRRVAVPHLVAIARGAA